MATARSEFRNTRNHVIGVMTRREDNKMKSLAVRAKDTIWLDEDEQIATANAPREEADNPFTNGDLELVTPATMVANRRPIGYTEHPQVPTEAEPTQSSPEESGLAAGSETPAEGSQEPGAGEDGTGEGGDPAEGAKGPEGTPEAAEDPAEQKRTLTAAEQEENARQAAARAVKSSAPRQGKETGAAPKPEAAAKAAQGSRARTEEVATPEAAGK